MQANSKEICETLNKLEAQIYELGGVRRLRDPVAEKEIEARMAAQLAGTKSSVRYVEHTLFLESEAYWLRVFAANIAQASPNLSPSEIAVRAQRICEELRPVPPRCMDGSEECNG